MPTFFNPSALRSASKSVLFIPGLLSTAAIWHALAQRLQPHVPHIHFVPKLEGKSIAEMAKQAATFLPEEPANIVAHSMGGYVACSLKELMPERIQTLVLVSSTLCPASSSEKAKKSMMIKTFEQNPKKFSRFVSSAFFKGQTQQALTKEHESLLVSMANELGPEQFVEQLKASIERPDRQDFLQNNPNTIIIHGAQDKIIPDPWENLNLPETIGYHSLPDTGHLVPIEQSEALSEILISLCEAEKTAKHNCSP